MKSRNYYTSVGRPELVSLTVKIVKTLVKNPAVGGHCSLPSPWLPFQLQGLTFCLTSSK